MCPLHRVTVVGQGPCLELWILALYAWCPHLGPVPVSTCWLGSFKEGPGISQPKSIPHRDLRGPKGHMWSQQLFQCCLLGSWCCRSEAILSVCK